MESYLDRKSIQCTSHDQYAHTAPKNILTTNAVASRQLNALTAGQTTMEQHTASAQRQLNTKLRLTGKTLS